MRKRVISVLSLGLFATLVWGGSATYAAQYQSNYDVLCSVTDKKVADAGRAQGKRLGTIAKEAGKLAEFQQQTLANKQARLTEKVDAGQITEEQAAQVVETIQQNQAVCDGTGPASGQGAAVGMGLGNGQGGGSGLGNAQGSSSGTGNRSGNGLQDGSGAGGQRGRNAGSCVITQ